MRKLLFVSAMVFLSFLLVACGTKEISAEEYDSLVTQGLKEILERTEKRPWRGGDFVPGRVGGIWYDTIAADPKSFNIHIAETDSATSGVVGGMLDYLVDYDPLSRAWIPHCASFEIVADEKAGKLDVVYTLRDDLFWSYYNSERRVPVTSDDVVFWYNEIEGDPAFQSSGYNGQFVTLEDGSEAHIDIEKLDERRFVFHFPRIVADPILTTNRTLAPRLDYEKAKAEKGVPGVRELFSIDTDPATIPSMGKWFLVEYTAGQRLVYTRNPDYWEKDSNGTSLPFIEEQIIRIIPDENTHFLLFKEGQIESYTPRPEDLDEVVTGQKGGEAKGFFSFLAPERAGDYTVLNAEGSLSASFWTFNQNPANKDAPEYAWFTRKEFRQAMSCLLNRERIINQVYRGLAEEMPYFFPPPNPFYNENIRLEYLYDPARAEKLLASIGMKRDGSGVMRDERDRAVEFDLAIRSESTVNTDIASIIYDELAKLGIKVNIRTVDFQKMVETLFSSFEWESMLMGLSGANIFPTQGSNVWPSTGNLHLWYPRQEKPATEWEARIDYLYNEGAYTINREKARAIWDEYQAIILEQCPLIYLVRPRSFVALRNRWDFRNVYFDNLNGFERDNIFLRSEVKQ